MSKDPKYYEWLYSIDGTANPGHCLVLNELPMMTPLAAITFVKSHFPEMTPKERPIVADRERASQIAQHSQHEVEYLITQLQMLNDATSAAADAHQAQAEGRADDLLGKVGKEIHLQDARDLRCQSIGIMMAISALRSRHMELASLAGPGRYSDWRL